MLAQLSFNKQGSVEKAVVGKGSFVVGEQLYELLSTAGIKNETMNDNGLSFIRRKNNNGTFYFINNRSGEPVSDWVLVNAKAASFAIFDPMTGKTGLAKWRNVERGLEIYLQLQPHESLILQAYGVKKDRGKIRVGKT